MKKLIILIGMLSVSTSFAMDTINLDTTHYHCSGFKLTSKITVNDLTTNCKDANVVMHDEPSGGMYANREPGGGDEMTMIAPSGDDDSVLDQVKFHSDKGSYLICYFNNNKFVKCKAKPTKNPIPKTLSSQVIATKLSASQAK